MIDLDEGAPERDARGEVAGVNLEARAADIDRFPELPGPPELFGELRKRDRRRVLLNPASKVLNPLVVGHQLYGTMIVCDAMPVRGGTASSVTLSVTVKVALVAGGTSAGNVCGAAELGPLVEAEPSPQMNV